VTILALLSQQKQKPEKKLSYFISTPPLISGMGVAEKTRKGQENQNYSLGVP
jgi:hypothetical protein